MSLIDLENRLFQELRYLEIPSRPWILSDQKLPQTDFDVTVIGAGMAGLTASFNLIREGINNIQIYDESDPGLEGPWGTYAHMRTLRSGKTLEGPAAEIPSLTFQAWYIAQHGQDSWEALYKIPTLQWMDYLRWYRKVLNLPVQNNTRLIAIENHHGVIKLTLSQNNKTQAVLTRKLVLATGRKGFGGYTVPEFMKNVPKSLYFHTTETIPFKILKNKSIGVVGVGASSFDSAAEALEHGAKDVTMMSRREQVGNVNKFASTTYPGFAIGFESLPDDAKIQMFSTGIENGAVPPFESLMRVNNYSNIQLLQLFEIEKVHVESDKVVIHSNQGVFTFDYLILGTGFQIDGQYEPELHKIFPYIKLWKDEITNIKPKTLGNFPYLGPHFQFLEKNKGNASYLKHIYCYNFGATLSHGLVSSDIPNISAGASRLAKGIVKDFFTEDWRAYYQLLQDYNNLEFEASEYPFIKG